MIGPVLWFLSLGCGGGGGLENCADVACKSELLIAAWDEGPEKADGLLEALSTELERVAVINALVQARGEPAASLCDRLAANPHGQRCHRIASRPHLRHEGGVEAAPTMGSIEPGACGSGMPGRACRALAAAESARRGQLDEATQHCQAEKADQWRQECHFQAAEAWMMEHGAERMPGATSLCEASGDFRGECLRHVVLSVVRGGAGQAWASAAVDARAIRTAFVGVDAEMGEVLVDRYWAEILANAWAGPRVGEGALPELPAEAAPHHRAGAAMRWIRDGAEPKTLNAAVVSLEDWMNRTGLPLHRLGEPFPRVDDAWDSGNGSGVSYLGASRRLVATRAGDDLAVCILEAAARFGEQRVILESGLEHPVKEVQETAQRLLSIPTP